MYEELDFYLNDYASTNNAILNYFYDKGFEDIEEIIEQFNADDWEKLFKEIDNKSDLWKERLVYCLGDRENQNQIKLLEKLLKTKDDKLFLQIINTLRTSFDVNSIGNTEEIIKKIELLIPEANKFDAAAFSDYIEKVNSGKHKL